MGIEADKIDEIITAHTEVVNGLKTERDELQAKVIKLENVEKEYTKLKEETGADTPFKDKFEAKEKEYDALKQEFADYKKQVADKELVETKKAAYRQLLVDAGISEKRIDSVLKVSDFSSVELEKDGKIKQADELVKNIKSEWADFIVTQHAQGAKTPNPPANNGGATFEKMSLRDKMAYANAHPNDDEVVNWLKKG